jgi:diacylglycerol kinase family enzyme
LTKYSVLCCCGGDGSYHETVNGMLNREDGLKIPVALIPNGSGNDLCSALGIMSLDLALNYIVRGECIRIDTVRILSDHESEDTLPEGVDRLNYCRHMMINSAVAMPAKIANTAIPMKNCCGNKSYEIAIVWEACKGNFRADNYDLFIDEVAVNTPGSHVQTTLLMVGNGKFTGGGIVINPFAVMNDGLLDVTWISDPAINNLFGVAGMLGDAKKHGGTQAYKGQNTYMRGREVKVVFRGRDGATEEFNNRQQLLVIDGEDLRY